MQDSELKQQDPMQLKMCKQCRAIRLWSYLNHFPFNTPQEQDQATFKWVNSGRAALWNKHLKR